MRGRLERLVEIEQIYRDAEHDMLNAQKKLFTAMPRFCLRRDTRATEQTLRDYEELHQKFLLTCRFREEAMDAYVMGASAISVLPTPARKCKDCPKHAAA
jgi:hypothetical protein